MVKEDGGNAFPTNPGAPAYAPDYPGMTLRDWFAGQALAGVMRVSIQQRGDSTIYWTDIATRAYGVADAMLAERNK